VDTFDEAVIFLVASHEVHHDWATTLGAALDEATLRFIDNAAEQCDVERAEEWASVMLSEVLRALEFPLTDGSLQMERVIHLAGPEAEARCRGRAFVWERD